MATYSHRSTTEGLPKSFTNYLRVLFDILDEEQTGFIRLTDVESRWEGDIEGLPPGILDALRKVCPPSGKLTFERFVGGLKIALLRNRKEQPMSSTRSDPQYSRPDLLSNTVSSKPSESAFTRVRPLSPPSEPPPPPTRSSSHHPSQTQPLVKSLRPYNSTTAAVRPNNALMKQRTISMPQLGPDVGEPPNGNLPQDSRYVQGSYSNHYMSKQEVPVKDKEEIVNALKNWQRERLQNGESNSSRWSGDGRASIASTSALHEFGVRDVAGKAEEEPVNLRERRGRGRREPRRHTLTNGIDFNMIKRMKQLEQERDILLSGLESVDRARDWYLREITKVQEKQKLAGKAGPQDQSIEAHQERLNFQITRISEVNQQLKALVESSEKGFPLHMNLAMSQQNVQKNSEMVNADNKISRLKAQNRMLTEEVSQKSDQITQLENEKTQLVRAMFESRGTRGGPAYEDSSYI